MLDNAKILDALLNNGEMSRLELPNAAGRLLVSKLSVPKVSVESRFTLSGIDMVKTTGSTHFSKVTRNGLYFDRCNFQDAGFFDCSIHNCFFEKCNFRDTGFWNSSLSDATFKGSNFRDCAFGGIDHLDPKNPNQYSSIVFDHCDLRGSAHSCETYTNCIFDCCELKKVEFYAAVFQGCTFRGKLDQVIFQASRPNLRKFPPNELRDCDFREAQFDFTEFTNIDLDKCYLPAEPNLIVLPRGRKDWDEWAGTMADLQPNYLRFIRNIGETMGTPTVVIRSDLKSALSDAQLDLLAEIAHRHRSEAKVD